MALRHDLPAISYIRNRNMSSHSFRGTSRGLSAIVLGCLLLGILFVCATCATPASARTKEVLTSELIYTPAVVVIPEVRTPDGELRTYRTPQGVSYWRAGLPVYKGDRVKLNVFVSTGGADLAETRVRLDNTEMDRRTAAPWHSSVDTGNLAEGYHYVEAWARTGGENPRAATAGLVFFVDPKPGTQADTASPVVQDVPPPSDMPDVKLNPGTGGPSVQISSEDPEIQKALDAGARVVIRGPAVFIVSGPGPSEGFVYALYRGDQQIHRSDVLKMDTRINLRPNAPNAICVSPPTDST
jgi:hypothetical protein